MAEGAGGGTGAHNGNGPGTLTGAHHCRLLKDRGLGGDSAEHPPLDPAAWLCTHTTTAREAAGPACVWRTRTCVSPPLLHSGPPGAQNLNPDVPRCPVLTPPSQEEKGCESQRPGAQSGAQTGPGRSPRGPPPGLTGRAHPSTWETEPRWEGPSPRTARRGAAAECHRKWPLLPELHRKGEAEAPRSCPFTENRAINAFQ